MWKGGTHSHLTYLWSEIEMCVCMRMMIILSSAIDKSVDDDEKHNFHHNQPDQGQGERPAKEMNDVREFTMAEGGNKSQRGFEWKRWL